jgi:hypothetical protein
VNNILALIDALAREGIEAKLEIRRKGRQWLVAVVSRDTQMTILLDRRGDRFLTAVRPTVDDAIAAVDALCARKE